MELRVSLAGDLGFAPRLVRILSSIGDADCNHHHYALRHPANIFHAVILEVAEKFQKLIDEILPLEQVPTNVTDLNYESLYIYKELLASFARYTDCAYEVILALCDRRPIADGDRKDLHKWLKKEGFNASSTFYGIIKSETRFFREVNNSLKHSSNALRAVTVLINSRPCLGYFVEAASSDGTVGPSRDFHKAVNGQMPANSFNRDLRLLYRCIYLVADALRRAVVLHYRSLHNQDPPDDSSSRYDDSFLRELFNKVASVPSVFYPKERGQIVPIATIKEAKDGAIMIFTDTKAVVVTQGTVLVSAGTVLTRDGKFRVPLP
ncbi:MAG: hypothetical protein ACLP0B_02420 [Steroidobacteraceae bacterium]|jgi:hypothetical protein